MRELTNEDVMDSIDILAKSFPDQQRLSAGVKQIMRYVHDHRGDELG